MKNKITVRFSAFLFTGLLICLVQAAPVNALSPEQFISRLKVKFRRTSSIYLQARVYPLDRPADSSTVTLAYRYPDRFLQVLRGRQKREQIVLFRGDSVAVYYPKIDIYKTRRLTSRQKQSLIVRKVPLAAMVAGLRSDSFPVENVRTTTYSETITARIVNNNSRLPYKKARVVFTRDKLIPLFFVIISDYKYKLKITKYEEESRFPAIVEEAFNQFNPRLLSGVDL